MRFLWKSVNVFENDYGNEQQAKLQWMPIFFSTSFFAFLSLALSFYLSSVCNFILLWWIFRCCCCFFVHLFRLNSLLFYLIFFFRLVFASNSNQPGFYFGAGSMVFSFFSLLLHTLPFVRPNAHTPNCSKQSYERVTVVRVCVAVSVHMASQCWFKIAED